MVGQTAEAGVPGQTTELMVAGRVVPLCECEPGSETLPAEQAGVKQQAAITGLSFSDSGGSNGEPPDWGVEDLVQSSIMEVWSDVAVGRAMQLVRGKMTAKQTSLRNEQQDARSRTTRGQQAC